MGQTHLIGSILGTAVGDAIGLPYEGLSPRRTAILLGYPKQHRLFWGWGMVSDDTEHTCRVAQALIASGGNSQKFQVQLAWLLRFWLLGLPAGVGLATLKSIVRLWCGFSAEASGVFSAGNGPAMRSAILGVAIADPNSLRTLVRISTRITHTDPKSEYGALAIALAARVASQSQNPISPSTFLLQLKSSLGSEANELLELIQQVIDSINRGESTLQFAAIMGLTKGVSGYIYHSVPIALHAWFCYPQDFRSAVIAVVECGGDTDSTAAIVGGIIGASVGKAGIPEEWLNRLLEPWQSVRWMENLAIQLNRSIQAGQAEQPLKLPFAGVFLRNLFFLLIVLFHGFRRLLPPY